MGRPHKERRVEQLPPVTHYKPAGVPLRNLEEVTLTIEEMEAIRLADIEQLDQAAAATRMEVSRPTFHRIVNTAHQKIAAALWGGHALRVYGGTFRIDSGSVGESTPPELTPPIKGGSLNSYAKIKE
ncbi:hypothetical protein SPSIL_019030 [Sporomusa silvacetica DSM 10669]|uniref:UPF0251 protein SPSIL_019030 n=1 Tax=Sporomusa silvacetica DSM 10669 TaxID=1123289 RepID=A0ABZ3IK16_9FIRM|nr:DUF134 domain-containing protein [Sporomusa silvacetica]OZC18842.1 hypothetical protein SPSIL_24520 [Sporomusa silvacetica DSM 10669]